MTNHYLKNTSLNGLVALVSTSLTLLVCEFIVSIFYPQDLSGSWREFSKKGYVLNKSDWQSNHQKDDRIVTYRFNSFHLRGDSVKKEGIRILVLGDSFTFGWLLDERDTFVSLFDSLANLRYESPIQFLNGGAGGWGLADFEDYLNEFGTELHPDVLIVCFNTDDIGRSVNREKYFNSSSSLNGLKSFTKNSKLYQCILENSHLAQLTRKALIEVNQKTDVKVNAARSKPPDNKIIVPSTNIEEHEVPRALNLGKEHIVNMNKWCKKENVPFMVITTGWHFDLYDNPFSKKPETLLLKDSSFFAVNHITLVDATHEVLKKVGESRSDYIIANDYHPNELGSKIIAESNWKTLKYHLDTAVSRVLNEK